MPVEEEDITLNNPKTQFMVKVLTFKHCNKFFIPRGKWLDCLQDIFLQIIKTRYIERFNPARGVSLAAYCNGLIFHFFIRKYRQLKRESSLFSSLDAKQEETGCSLLSCISDVSDFLSQEYELHEDVHELIEKLHRNFPYSSSAVYDGDKYLRSIPKGSNEEFFLLRNNFVCPRSVAIIFFCLYCGYSQHEIADLLQVSRPWVSRQVSKIRLYPPILEWSESLGS